MTTITRRITLAYDYTLNGMIKWARNVPHEATEELRQLVADGVEGIEHDFEEAEAAVKAAIDDVAPQV